MEECSVGRNQPFVADDQSPEVLQPGEGPLDLPTPFIPPHFASVVTFPPAVALTVGGDQIDTAPLEPIPQRIAVIAFVGDDPPGIFPRTPAPFSGDRDGCNCIFQQRHFRRRGRRQAASDRNTFAVHHHHPLRTFSTFGRPDARAPLFAGAKLPSAKVSSQSSRPWASKRPTNTRQTRSHTPCSSQSRRRRQHVLAEGYCLGRSFHLAPLRSTQRMPSKTSRFPTGLGPPFGERGNFGNNGSIFCHCSSVSFVGSLAMVIPFHDQTTTTSCVAQA